MQEKEIGAAVEAFAERFGTREPFALCRAMEIAVLFVPLTKNVRAFTSSAENLTVIYLDEALTETEQTVLLAHELGHAVLHRGLNAFFLTARTLFPLGKFEWEADCFARFLLKNETLDLSDADAAVRRILLP